MFVRPVSGFFRVRTGADADVGLKLRSAGIYKMEK